MRATTILALTSLGLAAFSSACGDQASARPAICSQVIDSNQTVDHAFDNADSPDKVKAAMATVKASLDGVDVETAPDDIRSHLEQLRTSFAAADAELSAAGYDFGAFGESGPPAFDTPAFHRASDAFEAYLVDPCGEQPTTDSEGDNE